VGKPHFYNKKDYIDYEKEVFLHVGLDLTIKNLIISYNLKIQKNSS
jgi:hypothetical protein